MFPWKDFETPLKGLEKIRHLLRDCGLPTRLSGLGVPRAVIDNMAEAAMTGTRLLKDNLREVTLGDAKRIHEEAY